MAQTDTTGQLSWLLDNLVDQVEHVQQALILSRDGLVVAASRGLTREDSEHLSALAAGAAEPGPGTGGTSTPARSGRPSSRWSTPSCSSSRPAQGTCLAVLTSADPNVGLIAYEMAMLVRRMGKYLAAEPRFPDQEIAAE